MPAGPIYNYEQALASDHVAAREMAAPIPYPIEGSFRALGFPVKMRGTPQRVRYAPPLLDQQGDEIRRELSEKGLLLVEARVGQACAYRQARGRHAV